MADPTVTLRLTIADPVPGVTYSLQDRKSVPVGAVVAGAEALSFDVPMRMAAMGKPTGEYVRREGPERRFVYVAIGAQAGQQGTAWSRRAKIDVHDLPPAMVAAALGGATVGCRLPGLAKDGGPACGTVRPLDGWQVVA